MRNEVKHKVEQQGDLVFGATVGNSASRCMLAFLLIPKTPAYCTRLKPVTSNTFHLPKR